MKNIEQGISNVELLLLRDSIFNIHYSIFSFFLFNKFLNVFDLFKDLVHILRLEGQGLLIHLK
jgi:hypothetical protein